MNHDIDALKKGDQLALKALFDDVFHHVWFYSWKITDNKYESEDIALRGFISSWEKINLFSTMKEMMKYLYVTVKNDSINYIKREKIKRRYERHVLQSEEHDVNKALESVTREVILIERLYEEVEKLPPQCKTMFKMYYLDNIPRKEIAKKLNVTIDTVNNQCRNAVIKLKAAFGGPEHVHT